MVAPRMTEKWRAEKWSAPEMAPCVGLHQEHLFVTNISVNICVLVAAEHGRIMIGRIIETGP